MTEIELRGVSVALDGRPVLSQLTLRIPGGSRLGLIGPNGSGKTTLLRAIAGLVPHRGQIRVGDAAGTTLSRRERGPPGRPRPPDRPCPPASPSPTTCCWAAPPIPYFGSESRRDLAIVASVLDHLDLAAFADGGSTP